MPVKPTHAPQPDRASATPGSATKTDELGVLGHAEALALVQRQGERISALERQVAWFQRQLFGRKSERLPMPDPQQLPLAAATPADAVSDLGSNDASAAAPTRVVASHTRRAPARAAADAEAEALPFFDEDRVPVETIRLVDPEVAALPADACVEIGEKISYRLAQRPASYVVLKYVRPVIKRRDSGAIVTAPAPTGVFGERSRADVSVAAGMLVDKFIWHLPLYRQHQRMLDAGIKITRPWLTQVIQDAIELLRPIEAAQWDSILASRVLAMDETPTKAGRAGPGKMKQGWFWPTYGDRDEVCFPFYPTRAAAHVQTALGARTVKDGVLLTDGYAAYTAYCTKVGVTHAQCWVHTRRMFYEARHARPAEADHALNLIRELYAVDEDLRAKRQIGEVKRMQRLLRSKPIVDAFFDWVDARLADQGLLPSDPLTRALAYAKTRRDGLSVFLTDPDVPLDTNHVERVLRPIPLGRKNWLFCWTELGATHVGIIQGLLSTCRLHGVDPYHWLVDVLQRVDRHPASQVAELTPRLWAQHHAKNPLRSPLYHIDRGSADG